MAAVQETIDRVKLIDVDQYKYGFETIIEMEKPAIGHSEDTVRYISARKDEPAWMLEWRLDAYRRWLTMREPDWSRVQYPPINYDEIYYYAAPKSNPSPQSLDEVDPEILRTYEKLGIPLREQEMLAGVVRSNVAVDAVFDSVSVATTFKAELAKVGVIFMPISEALREHPETGAPVSGHRRPADRQLLCDFELRHVLGRVVRLHPARRSMPDGAVHLFPHQRTQHGPVRAYADHRR
jgi:Fe-S cluster assembly protein SufB